MDRKIVKRDGQTVRYDPEKICSAINKAADAVGMDKDCRTWVDTATSRIDKNLRYHAFGTGSKPEMPTVEHIQDLVENDLMRNGHEDVAKAYILYRAERTRVRDADSRIMRTYQEITRKASKDSDMLRDNANINADSPMGAMLKYGSEGAKIFNEMYIVRPDIAKAHREGDIHIHDFDFYTLTETCCQIDIVKLLKGGFSTGHGHLREPQDIQSYAALAAIAIQSNQNDMHGGQSIPNFDYGMAVGVRKTFRREYVQHLADAYEDILGLGLDDQSDFIKECITDVEYDLGYGPQLDHSNDDFDRSLMETLMVYSSCSRMDAGCAIRVARRRAVTSTERKTYQAMEAFIHNLNTMHSRAGAQVPFSSINYGTDTSPEGRMVMKNVLLATEAGLGNGETPIFPIQIFKVKEGVNYNPGDPNYDLFKLAIRVSAKRLFPNFTFLDAPFNLQYYKPGHPETEVATMGCRTRVMGNHFDPNNEIAFGRGNLSFTSINLPRLGLLHKGDLPGFYTVLDEMIDLVIDQLLERFEIQCRKHVYNYPFLMGQGVWIGSDKLKPDDEVRGVLKHGTLTLGFIGLAECLTALVGVHHGESEKAQAIGLDIIGHMRERMDAASEQHGLNFSLIATPAEGLSGRFVKIDRERFGSIPGVTDREYYTNSFHIPVYYPISAFDKIGLEAPYHALTNGGHITYIELDGDTSKNLEAFEAVIRCMKESGIGYGAINHPVDRDPVCGYNGIIDDVCPKCGRHEDDGQPKFERIRRITGYLVGTLDRFNDAKRAEVRDRVKHGIGTEMEIPFE